MAEATQVVVSLWQPTASSAHCQASALREQSEKAEVLGRGHPQAVVPYAYTHRACNLTPEPVCPCSFSHSPRISRTQDAASLSCHEQRPCPRPRLHSHSRQTEPTAHQPSSASFAQSVRPCTSCFGHPIPDPPLVPNCDRGWTAADEMGSILVAHAVRMMASRQATIV